MTSTRSTVGLRRHPARQPKSAVGIGLRTPEVRRWSELAAYVLGWHLRALGEISFAATRRPSRRRHSHANGDTHQDHQRGERQFRIHGLSQNEAGKADTDDGGT